MSDTDPRDYGESDDQPQVGTDPMQLPQEDTAPKKQVAPDPDEVDEREHEG